MASETGRAQTERHAVRGCRTAFRLCVYSRIVLERRTIEGESPVNEIDKKLGSILSSAEQVEFCVNLGRPLSKAKYSLVTDSEQVP